MGSVIVHSFEDEETLRSRLSKNPHHYCDTDFIELEDLIKANRTGNFITLSGGELVFQQ